MNLITLHRLSYFYTNHVDEEKSKLFLILFSFYETAILHLGNKTTFLYKREAFSQENKVSSYIICHFSSNQRFSIKLIFPKTKMILCRIFFIVYIRYFTQIRFVLI